MYAITISEKEVMNLKERKEGYLGGYRRKKGEREMKLNYNLNK